MSPGDCFTILRHKSTNYYTKHIGMTLHTNALQLSIEMDKVQWLNLLLCHYHVWCIVPQPSL